MKSISITNTISTGLAMFSMFFGAGNVIFPLTIGQITQDLNPWAMLGLLITAVGVPFIGLISMTLFDGDYKSFFHRLGKWPGFLLAAAILLLIGPFGAMPRCIALAFSTIKLYLPQVTLVPFSIVSCLLIYITTFKRTRILDLLGYVLTPILLGSLGIIVVLGFVYGPDTPASTLTRGGVFLMGWQEGYQTMDLLGAFFFSSVVLSCLRQGMNPGDKSDYKRLISQTLQASCIGAGLLAITYIGFSFVTAFYSEALAGVLSDQLISSLSVMVLGPYAAVIACIAVSLTCLTTTMALASVSAEFIHIDLSQNRIGYQLGLIITLITTFLVSTLEFSGIKVLLAPVLEVLYPGLIVLSVMNLLHKLYRVESVKIPVFSTFVLSLAYHLFG